MNLQKGQLLVPLTDIRSLRGWVLGLPIQVEVVSSKVGAFDKSRALDLEDHRQLHSVWGVLTKGAPQHYMISETYPRFAEIVAEAPEEEGLADLEVASYSFGHSGLSGDRLRNLPSLPKREKRG